MRNLHQQYRTLSREQMLELWRLVRHFEPLNGAVSRTDGVNLDVLLLEELNRWYDYQYATLPAELLPTADIAADVTLSRDSSGAGVVMLPEHCHRVREVWMQGWERPATITSSDSELAREQCSQFIRGGSVSPVAVVSPGGEMRLYTPPLRLLPSAVCWRW